MTTIETCPQCGSDDISIKQKTGTVRCDACGFEESRSPKGQNGDNACDLNVLPSIIALPLKDYLDESHPVLKLWHACHVIELTLRLLVVVGLGDIRRQGDIPTELLNALRAHINEPTMGTWKAMAVEVAKHLNSSRSAVPELSGFVNDTLSPLLDGPNEKRLRTAENSFSSMRNQLAHGGGVTEAVGQRLLTQWASPFADVITKSKWLADLDFVVKDTEEKLGVLRGPSIKITPYENSAVPLEMVDHADEVVVVRGEHILSLWPFKLYGVPLFSNTESTKALTPVPLVYARRGEVRLQFTPIGSEEACLSGADEMTLDAFRALFRFDEAETTAREDAKRKGFSVNSFEADIRKDAAKLVGRSSEIDTLRAALDNAGNDVLWIPGKAGIGKSYLVAKLTTELLDDPPRQTLIVPYRFRVGDDRCSRNSFLQFAIERLEASPESPPVHKETKNHPSTIERLRELLQRLQEKKVLFILDGLDEIAERDAEFASSVILTLRQKGVTWLCAGRPERGLPEAFNEEHCAQPFPEGLPAMSQGDIRTMLLEKIGSLRKRLLQSDHEEDGRIVNSFIEKVAKAADGLPLYVTYVVGDIIDNRFRALDAGERLPDSLNSYHEELLRRCAVGDLHQVVTPLAATLAVAYEPLTVEMLVEILRRRTLVLDGERGVQLVRQGLAAIASMLRRAVTPEGEEGYTVYHHSLRQHILESESMRAAIELAQQSWLHLCPDWENTKNGLNSYLVRCAVIHAVDAHDTGLTITLFSDREYLSQHILAHLNLQELISIRLWFRVKLETPLLDIPENICETSVISDFILRGWIRHGIMQATISREKRIQIGAELFGAESERSSFTVEEGKFIETPIIETRKFKRSRYGSKADTELSTNTTLSLPIPLASEKVLCSGSTFEFSILMKVGVAQQHEHLRTLIHVLENPPPIGRDGGEGYGSVKTQIFRYEILDTHEDPATIISSFKKDKELDSTERAAWKITRDEFLFDPALEAKREGHLTEEDLKDKSPMELDLMRNEFFARAGFIFRRSDLVEYFSSQSWYKPEISDYYVVLSSLSSSDKYNAHFILNYQQLNGKLYKDF